MSMMNMMTMMNENSVCGGTTDVSINHHHPFVHDASLSQGHHAHHVHHGNMGIIVGSPVIHFNNNNSSSSSGVTTDDSYSNNNNNCDGNNNDDDDAMMMGNFVVNAADADVVDVDLDYDISSNTSPTYYGNDHDENDDGVDGGGGGVGGSDELLFQSSDELNASLASLPSLQSSSSMMVASSTGTGMILHDLYLSHDVLFND